MWKTSANIYSNICEYGKPWNIAESRFYINIQKRWKMKKNVLPLCMLGCIGEEMAPTSYACLIAWWDGSDLKQLTDLNIDRE